MGLGLFDSLGLCGCPDFPSPRSLRVLAATNRDVEVARFHLDLRHRRSARSAHGILARVVRPSQK